MRTDEVVPGPAGLEAEADGSAAPSVRVTSRFWWLRLGFLAAWGPGLLVMLADTDAGSLITASQSGARWGYRMILPQVILMPVLYVVQEITVRLGIVTGKGHGALIRERFGRWWALLSAGTLFASAVGALLTEFAGIAGVGELFGIPKTVTVPAATLFLIGLAMTGSYGRVERIGIAVGLAELTFFAALVMSHPQIGAVARGLGSVPVTNSSYVLLVAANVGAVIMPWMIFYQQAAVIDKKLSLAVIRQARQDTAFGSVLTQLIMIAVVIVVAATCGRRKPGAALSAVGQISGAVTPYLGHVGGVVLFGLGMLAAALVAAVVSSIAAAWGLAEVFGWKHTLNERPSRQTAKFYLTYSLAHIVGAALVLTSVNLVSLSIDVMIMNAMLLPVVLGFLLALEARAVAARWRMRGFRRYLTWGLCLLVMGLGLYMIPATTLHWA